MEAREFYESQTSINRNLKPVHDFTDLGKQILEVCRVKVWDHDWREGGCYLHLEVSEFIESLRGKHGTPVDEAGDALFVLIAMLMREGISLDESIESMKKRHGLK